jgi:hypothetical protein
MRRRTTTCRARRGAAAVIALLFVAIAGSLAVGIYASATLNAQIASNRRHSDNARFAAETGMEFMRYQLSRVSVTGQNNVIAALRDDLASQLNTTANLTSRVVTSSGATVSGGSSVGTVTENGAISYLTIPATGYIRADATASQAFRAVVRETGDHVSVSIEGVALGTPITRSVSMDYNRQQVKKSVFDHAVAAKGKITIDGGAVQPTTGVDPLSITVMSALPTGPSIVLSKPKAEVTGPLSIVSGGSVSISAGTVAGSTNASYIQANYVNVVDPPDFPYVDPSQYRAYATNMWNSSMGNLVGNGNNKKATLQNVYIPSGTAVKISGNTVIQGIVYLGSGASLTITGNTDLQGFIVQEDAGADSRNVMTFSGNFSHNPLPMGAAFNALRSVSGVSILAPTASVKMTGSVDSNLRGSMIVNKFQMTGSANVTIDSGSLIAYSTEADAVQLNNNNKWIRFNKTGATNLPNLGVSLANYYKAIPESYAELLPEAP